MRDLGVLVSSDHRGYLLLSEHCGQITKKGYAKCAMIYNSFQYRNRNFLFKLFKIYVRPGLEYATPVWSPIY